MGRASAAIEDPTGEGHPPWASRLTWGTSLKEVCTASLVRFQAAPAYSWALTAAHCFESINPEAGLGNVFAIGFAAPDVFLHPGAYGGATNLSELPPDHPPGPPNERADLALVRLSFSGAEGFEAIGLWYPADVNAATTWLTGKTLTFAGLSITTAHPIMGEEATGSAVVRGLEGADLVADPISHLQKGDSGGGSWLTLDATAPESLVRFPSDCALLPGTTGEPVLVGVNRAGRETNEIPSDELFTAVYPPAVAEWIASVTQADQDGDLLCDGQDNCPDVANSGQGNANLLAEDAWGGGIHLGDRCDAAPTPLPELLHTGFVDGDPPGIGSRPDIVGKYLVRFTQGRDIYDQLAVAPVLADGSSLLGSTAQPLFCDCRDEQLQPIEDFTRCINPNGDYRCILDPRQADGDYEEVEASEASIAREQTAWHAATVGAPIEPVQGAEYPVDFPGPVVSRQWFYELDYDRWVTQLGWMDPAAAPDGHGPGTDLGGAFWMHTPARAGAEQHGLPPLICDPTVEICSIADGFVFGVAPDPRATHASGSLLVWGNLPLCPPSCPFLSLEQAVINPQPFLAVAPDASVALRWSGSLGARLATEQLSAPLRSLMVRDDVLYVPASEPATLRSDALIFQLPTGKAIEPGSLTGAVGEPSSPRALFVVPDGAGGVELHALIRRSNGQLDLALVESLGGEVRAELAELLADPEARAHTAVIYSRIADALYLVQGGSEGGSGPPARIFQRPRPRPGLTTPSWTIGPLSAGGVFGASPRAVFSPRDWRIWVVDASGPPGQLDWRLRRIMPSTGEAVTDLPLPALGELEDVWLATYDDGRVLLAGNRRMGARGGRQAGGRNSQGKPERYVLVLLSSLPFRQPARLSVDAVLDGEGHLVTAPKVARGVVSLMVRHVPPASEATLEAVGFTAADFGGSWPALASDLEAP